MNRRLHAVGEARPTAGRPAFRVGHLWTIGILLFVVAAFPPTLARAQSNEVEGGYGAAGAANGLLLDALASRKAQKDAARRAAQAQPKPGASPAVGATPIPFAESIETPKPGIVNPSVPGVHYTIDVGSVFPYGNIGFHRNNLPGTFDAVLFAGPDPYTRLQVGYYQLDQYPIGFDTGSVPAYLEPSALGLTGSSRVICNALGPALTAKIVPNPDVCDPNTGTANLGNLQQDASTKNRIWVVAFSKLIYVSLPIQGGVPYPIVVTPNYVAATGQVGGFDDAFLAFDPTNQKVHKVRLRTMETKGVFFTFPFAKSSKLFASYTIGPQWLLNTNGLNQDNHAQLFQFFDIRYFATDRTTIFFQPSRLQNYFPVDPYSERVPAMIAGFSHIVAKPLFIQGWFGYGTPQNPVGGHTGRIGVVDVTCISFPACINNPDPRTNTAVQFGGLKASFFNLQVGIGTPSIIPL